MAQTSQMPKSIHGSIQPDAVGEALLQHYNVGIKNPWFELGMSDQQTYTRRQLPWAGKNYEVTDDGAVIGPNAEELPDALKASWQALSEASREHMAVGEGNFASLETMMEEGLTKVGAELKNNSYSADDFDEPEG